MAYKWHINSSSPSQLVTFSLSISLHKKNGCTNLFFSFVSDHDMDVENGELGVD